jgi:hypothetical protein
MIPQQLLRRKPEISTNMISYNLDTPDHTDVNVTNMLHSIMPRATPDDESVRVGVIGSGNVSLDTNPRAYADEAPVYTRKNKKKGAKTKRRKK